VGRSGGLVFARQEGRCKVRPDTHEKERLMSEASTPYAGLPARAFWRTGLVEAAYPPPDLFLPRWQLDRNDRIVTAGSCFSQRLGRALRAERFRVVDTEPATGDPRNLGDQAAAYGYGLYSARYGNIYTVRQLRQLLEEAHGQREPADLVWEKDGRFFDALRPNIEPEGFEAPKDVRKARKAHLACVREAFAQADVFIFTLGLTEAWVHKASGQVYPVAPGVLAGQYDPAQHVLANFRLGQIKEDFEAVVAQLRTINPDLRILLTVSPVAKTATAGAAHVLAASTYTKSVLRACAGELYADHPEIDYFPSYEMIVSAKAAGQFYDTNLRTVSEAGVTMVMRTFLAAYGVSASPQGNGAAIDDDAQKQARKAARKAERRAEKGKF
jgi:GSCFA family